MNNLSEKRKIAIFTYSLNSGGVSTFVAKLSEVFIRDKYEVDILTTEEKGEYYSTIKKRFNSVFNVYYGLFGWMPLGRIIHSIITGIIIRKKKYSIVFIIHSYAAQSSIFLYYRKTKVFSIIQNSEKNVIKLGCANKSGLNGIICVSPSIVESAKVIAKKTNCFLIENSVDVPSYDLFSNRSVFENKLRLLYVGRMDDWQKGIFILPHILKKCLEKTSNIELSLAGDGDDLPELKAQFNGLGISQFVKFLGLVESSEIKSLYASHHVLIMPSKFEGLPFVLIEAMSWGCVPVVSLLNGVTDFCVDDGKNGFLVERDNVQQFADSILKIYNNPHLWKMFSLSAREKVIRSFSFERMAGKYRDLVTISPKKNSSGFLNFLMMFELYSFKEVIPNKIILLFKKKIKRVTGKK